MKRVGLTGFVLIVALAAVAAAWSLQRGELATQPGTLLVLVALAALVGVRPIRMGDARFSLTFTHPMVLCALAAIGPGAGAAVALAGVAGGAFGSDRRPKPIRLFFNLSCVLVSIVIAGFAYRLAGGGSGDAFLGVLLPLLLASSVYYLVNTGLVATVISVERGGSLAAIWSLSFRWVAASYVLGYTIACALLLFLDAVGPLGLLLGAPPCWILAGFYREQRRRADERQQRIEVVEQLNAELDDTVQELRKALAQVKQLEGLLPICMHCKKIRDDQDDWQQIETFITEHSEARFTHSVCAHCRETHYPETERCRPQAKSD